MSETTQAPFTMRDGLNVALYDWPAPVRRRPRGVVLIVHGLGEHAWRHDPLAQRLNAWGFAVRAHDQRGHGESGGQRGVLPDEDALLDDLAEVLEDTRHHLADPYACPLILLGHSLGGLVASAFVQRSMGRVDGLVLSSPAFDVGLTPMKHWLIAAMLRLAPGHTLSNGLDPAFLSHDATVVKAYREDRRVHDRISARLARFIERNAARVRAAAPRWRVPTLLLYAGDDRLVRPAGSDAFAAAAPPGVVRARRFDGLWHEVFNEQDNAAVFDALAEWLDRRAPPR